MGKKAKKTENDNSEQQTPSRRKSKSKISGAAPFLALGLAAAAAYLYSSRSNEPRYAGGPARLEEYLKCGARCGMLTAADKKAIQDFMISSGCGKGGSQKEDEVCEATPEQICVTVCTEGQTDMTVWLQETFGPGTPEPTSARMGEMYTAFEEHLKCSAFCADGGVTVDVSEPGYVARASDVLKRCGVVQLAGPAFDPALFEQIVKSFNTLRSQEGRYKQLLADSMLRGGRYQVFLPYVKPFSDRNAIAGEHVFPVLKEYFKDHPDGFGFDHITVLSSAKKSENQTLHPDVPYFRRQHLSVHTALYDITYDMGPTYFCPCTGEASADNLANIALRMLTLKLKECLGRSYVRQFTPAAMVTIYDGVTFHKGLENTSPKERHLLKLELGSGDYPIRRNYERPAPNEAKVQTQRFRAVFGPPMLGIKA